MDPLVDILRPYQIESRDKLIRALDRHGAALDGSDTGCHPPGTKILLFDGSVKAVEEIKVGDLLMGPDSTPREVLDLISGFGKLYRVIPVKGESWAVNDRHILTVRYTKLSKRNWLYSLSDLVEDVPVSTVLTWSPARRHIAKLWRVGVDFPKDPSLPIHPYHLGLLLGDGYLGPAYLSLSKPGLAKAAFELAEFFQMTVRTYYRSPGNPSFIFRAADKLKKALVQLDLYSKRSFEKHVPRKYLINDRLTRLEMLAGLLDTDGHMINGGFEFSSTAEQLALNVQFLARSLGFAAYIKSRVTKCQTGASCTSWRVYISGDCSIIPTRLKKAPTRRQIKNVLVTGFRLEAAGTGVFHGFSLTGDGRYLLADFTVTHNTGKTWVASAVAAHYEVPTLAVVPKIAISDWKNVARACGTSFNVLNWEMLRTGRTPFGRWDSPTRTTRWTCRRCFETSDDPESDTPCRNNAGGPHDWVVQTRKAKSPRFVWHPGIQFLIFDEVHRAAGQHSQNSAMLVAAKRQRIRTLALSATPAISPLQMKALGYLLGLHQLTGDAGFYPWLRGWGCRPHPLWKGWVWQVSEARQLQTMQRISEIVFNGLGNRVRREDLPDFPGRDIQPILLDLEAPGRLDALYYEMRESLARLKGRKELDKDPQGALTKLLRARQEVELLKVPLAVEKAEDLLEEGYSVGIFVNFTETLTELRRRLKCNCFIDGSQTGDPAGRQRCIDQFQDNSERLIIVNSHAGGQCVNLQDLHGGHQRVGLVFPGPSAVDFQQLVGRFQRDGAQSVSLYQVLLAAHTCEEQIARKLIRKLNNLSMLLDGDLMPDDFSLPT